MGDTIAARLGRLVEKAAACAPPSTAIPCADGGIHGGAINQLDLNAAQISRAVGASSTVPDVDVSRLAYAEWAHECLQKAQRYWSPP